MARTQLDVQVTTIQGLAPTTVTPDASGAAFRLSSKAVLMVTNGSASSITVTPKIAKTVEGQSVTSPARTLAAGATAFYGPFNENYDQLDGSGVLVDFSAVADVSVALLSIR